MNNIYENISNNGFLALIFIASLFALATTLPALYKQYNRYKSFKHAPPQKRFLALVSLIVIGASLIYSTRAYEPAGSDEIAIVLGNTQNTPAPLLEGQITAEIKAVMLKNKDLEPNVLAKKIVFISASGSPTLIKLDNESIKLQKLGQNSKIANTIAENNLKKINEYIKTQKPSNQGANYLEAIFKAKDNVATDSKIIVIGSGLSDSGTLNFSKTALLTDKNYRDRKVEQFMDSDSSLDGYTVYFNGLGDSNPPQEPLADAKKRIVRDIYKKVMSSLGAKVEINTKSLTGPTIDTPYTVGTTDTGCGNISLIFTESDNIKFIPNQSNFLSLEAANQSLSSIKDIYNRSTSTIVSIQIDGYIANAPGADTSNLSQLRADTVKQTLVGKGIPANIIGATGRGIGPNANQDDNRYVKVTINRNNEECQ